MKLYYDLHMHSCLSPCGEEEMTPNNIVNMAAIKELHMIAVTDHNSARNLPAVQQVAEECGVLLIPGLEITTAEEIHLLGYFESVKAAVAFGENIYDALPDISNRPDIFGCQHILDAEDNIVGSMDKLLINACAYTYDELFAKIRSAGGVPVPAHVNKSSNAVIMTLGCIPDDPQMQTIEVWEKGPLAGIDVERYRMLNSSDAHQLIDMAEPTHYLNVEPTVSSVLEKLCSRQ